MVEQCNMWTKYIKFPYNSTLFPNYLRLKFLHGKLCPVIIFFFLIFHFISYYQRCCGKNDKKEGKTLLDSSGNLKVKIFPIDHNRKNRSQTGVFSRLSRKKLLHFSQTGCKILLCFGVKYFILSNSYLLLSSIAFANHGLHAL